MDKGITHYPVLHREVLQFFQPIEKGIIVDATVGGGGHASLILQNNPNIKLIGIDRDIQAVERARERLKPFGSRAKVVKAHFKDLDKVLDDLGIDKVEGFLFDLGVSTFQLKTDRGFSFQKDQPLDMRMDLDQQLDAYQVVNRYPKVDLERIIKEYGEERFAKRIAKAIVEERKKSPIETTKQLADIVYRVYPPNLRRGRIHPATRTFQAIRIEVNDELRQVEQGVEKAIHRLNKDGIIQVISFHSLEDRIVKRLFQHYKKLKVIEVLTKKPITPSQEEVKQNPPSRSAKLRVGKKKDDS
ncbi:MAG: 16S rRNA (cytosine(1402)-N(4))-methyltransferase RsmH [Aquificae bacterium]|nr:16S rRNA (cytosine(1402)-N(4))-methyltransferase RsmH [Aquificota bacterium]